MIAVPAAGLRSRVLTALVLIPPVVAGVLWLPGPWLVALFAAVVLAAAWEWADLAGFRHGLAQFGFVLGIGGGLVASGLVSLEWVLLGGVVWWVAAVALVVSYPAVPRGRLPWAIMGILVLVPPWAALVGLAQGGLEGRIAILALFFLVWAADIGAYFTGRRYGRHRLTEVSPGKTWEGLAGGVLAAMLVAGLAAWALGFRGIGTVVFMGIAVMTVLASVLGDLLESLLKRLADRKDSGALLPGHGGLLDRIDSLTAAAPVFVLGLSLMWWSGL